MTRKKSRLQWEKCINFIFMEKHLRSKVQKKIKNANSKQSFITHIQLVKRNTKWWIWAAVSESWSLGIYPLSGLTWHSDLCAIKELKTLLRQTKRKNDDIPLWLLYDHAMDLAPVITHLLNQYSDSKIPIIWTSPNVAPIPMEEDPNQPTAWPVFTKNVQKSYSALKEKAKLSGKALELIMLIWYIVCWGGSETL